jgi:hypothetical protein
LQDFTLQQASKMGVLYTHSPKSPGPFSKLPKNNFKEIKKVQKNGIVCPYPGRPAGGGRPLVAGWPWVDTWTGADCPFFFEFFFSHALHFLHKWSTLAGWLQYMPALARPCPKTSNIHNF